MANIKISKDDIVQEIKLSGQLPEVIDHIIDRKIITAAIAKLNIAASDEELQAAADQFRLLNNLQTAQATMMWLQDHSLTVPDLESIAEQSVNTAKLVERLFSKEEIEKYFFEKKLNYVGLVMYEIVVESEDLAMEIFYSIQEGEVSFHQAARQYINDPQLRRTGGYSGIRRRSELLPDISAAIFLEPAPRLLKPIITSQGTHLIYVEEMIEPQIEELLPEIVQDLFGQWLQRYKNEMDIVKAF